MRALPVVLILFILSGCREADQVIVILESEEDALEGAEVLRVRVCDQLGEVRLDRSVDLMGGPESITFPTRIPVVPAEGDLDRIFELRASLQTRGGLVLQSQRVISTFRAGSHEIRRRFEPACSEIVCSTQMTCTAESYCVTSVESPIELSTELPEALLECASEEVCNGWDDDDDGLVDEGLDADILPTVCPVAMGRFESSPSWERAEGNQLWLTPVSLSACERVSGAYAHLEGDGNIGSYQPHRVVLYSNGDGDAPASLVSLSEEVRVFGDDESGWFFFRWETSDGALEIPAGSYWMGLLSGQPTGEGAAPSRINGIEQSLGYGRIGEITYTDGPDELFHQRDGEEGLLDFEPTLFAACAP